MVYLKTFSYFLFYFHFWSVFSDGCRFLCSKPDILTALFALTHDPSTAVVKQCYLIFVNLSADEASHQVIGLCGSPQWSSVIGV